MERKPNALTVVFVDGDPFIATCASRRGRRWPAIQARQWRLQLGSRRGAKRIANATIADWASRGCLHLDGENLRAAHFDGRGEWFVDEEQAARINRSIAARLKGKVSTDRLFLTGLEAQRHFDMSWFLLKGAIERKLICPEQRGPFMLLSRLKLDKLAKHLGKAPEPHDAGDPELTLRELAERLGVPSSLVASAASNGVLETRKRTRPGALRGSDRVATLSAAKEWQAAHSRAFDSSGVHLTGQGERLSLTAAAKKLGVKRGRLSTNVQRGRLATEKLDRAGVEEHTVDLEEAEASLSLFSWSPPKRWLTQTQIAERIGAVGFFRRNRLIEALREGRETKAFLFQRQKPPPRAYFYETAAVEYARRALGRPVDAPGVGVPRRARGPRCKGAPRRNEAIARRAVELHGARGEPTFGSPTAVYHALVDEGLLKKVSNIRSAAIRVGTMITREKQRRP